MNATIKIIGGFALLILILFVGVTSLTTAPKEALNNCIVEGNRTLSIYSQKLKEMSTEEQKICADATGEISLIKQCINNTYEKYGRSQTSLAKRILYMNGNDPLTQIVKDHNEMCSKYPDSEVKE